MEHYAVIDTNVVVSSMLKKDSIPGIIMELVVKGEIVPLLNDEILNEYEEVLSRKEFGFDLRDIRNLISGIIDVAIVLERSVSDEYFDDEDDRVFYEIALTGKSLLDSYLVTGNKKHFPSRSFVVTPREMFETVQMYQLN